MDKSRPDNCRLHFVQHRGSLALFGQEIDEIAEKWVHGYDDSDKYASHRMNRLTRDGKNHHLTVIFSQEFKKIPSVSVDILNETVHQVKLIDLGVGETTKDTHHVVIYSPKLQKLRRNYGLGPCDFHITLGFSNSGDCHEERKDFSTLVIPPRDCRLQLCRAIEMILSAPSSAIVRGRLHYTSMAEFAMHEGYLFGAFYVAKYACEQHGDKQVCYDILEQVVSDCPGSCKILPPENDVSNDRTDYGELVCSALNYNITSMKPFHRLRRLYTSTQIVQDGRYDITYKDMPRNFSFVSSNLCGSSILDRREYFESLVAVGVTDVITLMEDPILPRIYSNLPLAYHFYDVVDRTPPTITQMQDIMRVCENAVGSVCIHCQGGVGRTATALVARLMWSESISRVDAISRLQHRKTILSSSQESFLSDWYEVCLKQAAIEYNTATNNCMPPPGLKLPPVIILVGYPSSGKSTFADALSRCYPNHIHRANQDESSRRDCEEKVGLLSKRRGHTVILDRCNLTRTERKEWLALAHQRKAWAVLFTASVEECRWRIVRRCGHPTIRQGGGGRIIDSLAGTLEEPTVEEGFDKVLTVSSFEDCNALLREWGCNITPVSTIPEEEGLIKFPRTRHVVNLGSATRDDLIMTTGEVTDKFLNREVFVEEKIDGANMGLCIRNGRLCAQNRSHFVTSEYHAQFKHLDKWLHKHGDELWRVLESDRYILYGEWVYARHSIHYTRLPDWFVIFDLYDRLEQKFWSRPRLQAHLEKEQCTLPLIPIIAHKSFRSMEELRALVNSPSIFYDGPVEGVYIRANDADAQWLENRGKIVRPDFLSGNEFWSKGGVQANVKAISGY